MEVTQEMCAVLRRLKHFDKRALADKTGQEGMDPISEKLKEMGGYVYVSAEKVKKKVKRRCNRA